MLLSCCCYSWSPVTQSALPCHSEEPGFDLVSDPTLLTIPATLAVTAVCSGGGSKAGGRCQHGSIVLCCKSWMVPAPPPSLAHHLLGRLGVVLQSFHRHDAALQVCPAANSPLQRLGHLVREDTSGQLQQGHPTGEAGAGRRDPEQTRGQNLAVATRIPLFL